MRFYRRLLRSSPLQSSAQDWRRLWDGFGGRCLLWQAVNRTCSQDGLDSTPAAETQRRRSCRAQYVPRGCGAVKRALTHPGYQACHRWGCLRSLWSCLWSRWPAPGTRSPDVALPRHTGDKHTSLEEAMETDTDALLSGCVCVFCIYFYSIWGKKKFIFTISLKD